MAETARPAEAGTVPSASQSDQLREFVAFLVERHVLSAGDVKRILQIQARMDRRFGTLAVLKSFVSPHDVIFILYQQTESGERLGELAIKSGLMTREQVKEVLLLQSDATRLFAEILVRTRTVSASNLQKIMRDFYDKKGGGWSGPGKPPAGTDFAFPDQPVRMSADRLKIQLRQLKDLATLPGVVHRVLGLLQNPHVEMSEVAQVIEGDPSLSVRLLRLANSAFFALITKVSTVQKALITLGVNNVRKTIITASVLEKFKGIDPQEAAEYWRHSLLTSRWTRRLLEMQNQRGEALEDGAMAGLLHDTGRLAVWQFFADANVEIRRMVACGSPAVEAEREVLSMAHDEIGAFLFQIWNFPVSLLQAACYHHGSVETLGNLKDAQPLAAVVNAACRISHLPVIAGEDGSKTLDVSSLEPEFVMFHKLDTDALVRSAPAVIREANTMLSSFITQTATT